MTVKFIELQDRKIVTQMFEENPVWYMTCFSHFFSWSSFRTNVRIAILNSGRL
jgi:hypothetical protein